ncbi:MAG: DUF2759 family protein [Candidatus Pristimantibacillus lignocellulolyticus]|uniref:DUF2759 family protein n=1 Tax=Candidatus Pristimantibacillus lignocellulolyticus TaxID=2994561 RepID=A0A9J6ZIX9_9BACL|nr:MAG: DUF2759 family protein [Candidatus Pristimantibacillus lignocellulolyticus]
MFLAAEATEAATKAINIDPFDWFMLAFTIVIAIGFVRLVKEKKKNIFAIGFATVSLAVFVVIDVIMISQVWF